MSILSSALNVAAPGIGEVLSFLLDTIRLLFNPRVWVIVAVVFVVGRVQGCKEEEQHFASREAAEAKLAAVQAEHTKGVNARNKAIQEEVDNAHTSDVAMLVDLLDDANEQLRRKSSGGFVPRPGPGAAKPVPNDPELAAKERTFLTRVYNGQYLCYDSGDLDRKLQGSAERLFGRLNILGQSAGDALDNARWWAEWAAKVGACTK